MRKLKNYIMSFFAAITLSSCVPPLPFMETSCLPPISTDDISPEGMVKVTQDTTMYLAANGIQKYRTISIRFGDIPLDIQIPNGYEYTASPWVSAETANSIRDSDIKIKQVSGTYYKGPNLYDIPENNDYELAYNKGEYRPEKGGYFGKRFIITNSIQGACVYGDEATCSCVSKETCLNDNDLVFLTIAKEGEQFNVDTSGNQTVQTSFNVKNEDWVKNNKLYEEAEQYHMDANQWIRQRIIRQLVGVAYGGIGYRIFGKPLAAGVHDTTGYGIIDDEDAEETKKDYTITRKFMIKELRKVSVSQSMDNSKTGDTSFKLQFTIPDTDVEATIVAFVKILRNQVDVNSDDINGINMAIVNCDPNGDQSQCNPNPKKVCKLTTDTSKSCIPSSDVDPLCTCTYKDNEGIIRKRATNIHEDYTTHVANDSKVWFKIVPEENTDQQLYSGNVNVTLQTKAQSSGAAFIYLPILKIIKKFGVYGVKDTYTGMTGISENGEIKSTNFIMLIKVLLMLYVTLLGLQYTAGLVQVSAADIVFRVLRISIVAILIDPAGWKFISDTVFFAVIEFPSIILRSLNTSDLSANLNAYSAGSWQELITQVDTNVNDPFFFMNQLLALFFHPEIVKRTFALILAPAGLVVFILVVAGIVFILKGFVRALFLYFFSIIMVCFLLAIAPLFIPFVLFKFEPLKRIFETYLTMIMRYTLEPVILFAGLYVIASVFMLVYTNMILSLHLCFKCAFPIHLNLGPLGDWPLLTEIERMLCFWSLMPWGMDNFGTTESPAYGSSMILVGRYLIFGIIMVLLGVCYDGYVTNINNIVQSITKVYLSGGLGNVGLGGQPTGAFAAFDSIAGMASGVVQTGKGLAKNAVKQIKKRSQGRMKTDVSEDEIPKLTTNPRAHTQANLEAANNITKDKLSNNIQANNDNYDLVDNKFANNSKNDLLERMKSELPEYTEKLNSLQNKNIHHDDMKSMIHDAMSNINAENALLQKEISQEITKPSIDRATVNDKFDKLSQNFNSMKNLNSIEHDINRSQMDNINSNLGYLNNVRNNGTNLNMQEQSYFDNLSAREPILTEQQSNLGNLQNNLNNLDNEIDQAKESVSDFKNKIDTALDQPGGPNTDSLNTLSYKMDEPGLHDLSSMVNELDKDEFKTKDDLISTLENEITSYFGSLEKDGSIADAAQFENNLFNEKLDSMINSYRLEQGQVDSIRSGLLIKAKQAYGL